ncbi:MAG TPA: protein kinase [Thermoguttaceae bacterium]|nr:protein kinase [Thermoguttaceae bacterium]
MAITSAEEFLNALSKSQLLKPEQLAHAQDTLLLAGSAEQFAEILVEEGLLTEWQASQLMAGLTRFTIGNYVLLDLLGRGGMGSVFLARHLTMNRQVALKVISRRVGKDPASRDRFLSEARATALLDHPNIVRAYDVDKDQDRFYIVMEHVAGHDLEELVELEGPLDFEFIVDCMRQAAQGLAHAHQRNMVHCDIKPSNLLVTESGTIKILDMGMARLINQNAEDSSSDRDGRIPGTVDYMAPEQATEGPDFDHRADIYSLGCTMYFMLTGHPPFHEGSLAQRIVQHQTQSPPDILAEHPDTPPDLARICLKMMAKNPSDRYQTADELAKVLAAWRPPAPGPAVNVVAAQRPLSTGVAIGEEEFQAAQPMNPLLPKLKAKAKPKGFMSEERRPVFWLTVGTIVMGSVVAVVAIIFIARANLSGSPLELSNTQVNQGPPAPQPVSPSPPTSRSDPGVAPSDIAPPDTRKHDPIVQESRKQAAGQPTKRTERQPRQAPRPSQPSAGAANLNGVAVLGSSGATASSGGELLPPGGILVSPDGSKPSGRPPRGVKPPPRAPRLVKPVDPLRGLSSTVDLPPPSSTDQPLVLGKLSLTAADQLALELLGGESAIDGPGHFVLQPRAEPSQWTVRLIGGDNVETDAARIGLSGDELAFTWLAMTDDAAAGQLRNCLLEVRVGGASRVMGLRKALSEPDWALDLSRGTAQKRWTFSDRPDNAALRLTIRGIAGFPGRSSLKPAVVFKPGEKKEIALFQRNNCKIILRSRYIVTGSASHLEMTVHYRLATRGQAVKFSANRAPLLAQQVALLEQNEQRITLGLTNPRLSEAKKKQRKDELRRTQNELKWLRAFLEWYQASQGILHVRFEEFVAVGEHRLVVLATQAADSEASPPPAAPEPDAAQPAATSVTPSSSNQGQVLKLN